MNDKVLNCDRCTTPFWADKGPAKYCPDCRKKVAAEQRADRRRVVYGGQYTTREAAYNLAHKTQGAAFFPVEKI